jgi:hypothetical protein
MKTKYFIFLMISLIYIECDKGIEPLPEKKGAGFGGKITFIGQWSDSVTRTHLVIFKDPLNSAADFNIFNLRFVSNEIPFGVEEFNYSSFNPNVIPGEGEFQPGDYAYVAVAQQTTEDVSLNRVDWFVAGVYYYNGDTTKPGTLIIPPETFIDNINITCDFNNPPPQPPGGN